MNLNHHKRKKIVAALVLATILVILTYIFNNYLFQQEPLVKNGFYFNTIIAIQLNDSQDESLINTCFDMANTYEHYFSRTLEGSDIYNINHANGAPVEVHDETAELIRYGIAFGDLSDGVFDISIGALTDLWDIPNNNGTIPAQTQIDAALATVDYRQITVDGNTVTLGNPDAALDLGGIAKGYVADRMREYLNANGACEGFINLGGNVLTLGQKANDEPYHIGIRKPFGEDGETITAVDVTDRSIVTYDIACGSSYVMLENGEIVGTFALFLGEDESYRVIEDGAWHLDQPYGTIHRLASNGKARGVSKACFDFCTAKVSYLRADTHENNRTMQSLLEAYGFQKCGTIHSFDGLALVAYDYIVHS